MSIWQAVVVIDSVDRSSSIIGQITVEAEESVSRIAKFTLRPPSGPVSAGDWLGVSVTIDYKTLNSAGAPLSQDRIFTGIVDQAIYDPQTQLTSFDCTDDMQGKFEAMTQATIDGVVTGARWAESVFGEYKDGWLYLENLLETIPAGIDYNADGTTLTQADFAAKVTPDFSFTESQIIDDSMSYSLAPRRELFNKTVIEYDYRFRRLKHREHGFSWSFKSTVFGWSFCNYLADSHEMPTREMVTSAAEGAGWGVQYPIAFTKLLESGTYCGGTVWAITEALRDSLVTAAGWTAAKRWSQEVTEKYTITVDAPQSVSWLGTVQFDEFASGQTETSEEGWQDDIATPTGARTDSLGDMVFDKYDRTASDNDIETLVARARTEILRAHRGNWVEGKVELQPTIERYHTVKLDGGNLVGQGKVFMITHEMDSNTGEATSIIRVAVSLNGGAASGGDSAIIAPTAPNTDPVTAPPATSTSLQTHLGGKAGAAVYDETWDGFTGNYTALTGGAEVYPRRFRVDTPEINQDAIDAVEGTASQTYSFDIPDETLTITVP